MADQIGSLAGILAQAQSPQTNSGGVLADIIKGVLSRPAIMPPAKLDSSFHPSWYRADGTRKGMGFLGPLPHKGGGTSTELSIGVDIGGKETEIPALVPTLTKQEIDHLLSGGSPTNEIVEKALQHAQMRMQQGLPVFKEY